MSEKNVIFVVADSSIAKIYNYSINSEKCDHINTIEHPEGRMKTSEIVSDEAGRYQKSAPPNQGAYEPNTDPKKVEAEHFAKELADKLNSIAHNEKHHKFIIIAPGNFYSLIKNHLKKRISEKSEFVDKNYTKFSDHDLKNKFTSIIDN